MRWARFEQNGTPTYGVVEGDEIIPVRGSPFDMWERTAARLALAECQAAGAGRAADILRRRPELRRACARGGGEDRPEVELPKQADAGYRANNALIAHGEAIVIPKDATDQVQYEGELVAVIGRKCRHLTRDNALSAVLGYTIGNDVSERTWQKGDRTLWRAKNTDTFKPMGPWIETNVKLDRPGHQGAAERQGADRVPHQPHGVRRGGFPGGDDEIPDAVSRRHGVDGHRGRHRDMKHGDVCEIEISGIGTLRNPVVRGTLHAPRHGRIGRPAGEVVAKWCRFRRAHRDRRFRRRPQGRAADRARRAGGARGVGARRVAGDEVGQVVFGNVIHTEPKDMYLGARRRDERRRRAGRAGADGEPAVRLGPAGDRFGGAEHHCWAMPTSPWPAGRRA